MCMEVDTGVNTVPLELRVWTQEHGSSTTRQFLLLIPAPRVAVRKFTGQLAGTDGRHGADDSDDSQRTDDPGLMRLDICSPQIQEELGDFQQQSFSC